MTVRSLEKSAPLNIQPDHAWSQVKAHVLLIIYMEVSKIGKSNISPWGWRETDQSADP